MGKAEKRVEDHLINEVKKLGGFTRKYTSPGFRGVPDRIVFIPPFGAIFVELKTLTGVYGKKQIRELNRINAAGGRAVALAGKNDVDRFIWRIENAQCDAMSKLESEQAEATGSSEPKD